MTLPAKHILACVDFSDVTESVIAAAGELARVYKGGVCLLHAAMPEPDFVTYDVGPQYQRDAFAKRLRDEHRKLQDYEEQLKGQGLSVKSLLVQGSTVEKILEEAERFKTDLIVLGSHGHGSLYELIVGSVTEGVLRKTTVPVLVVPSPR